MSSCHSGASWAGCAGFAFGAPEAGPPNSPSKSPARSPASAPRADRRRRGCTSCRGCSIAGALTARTWPAAAGTCRAHRLEHDLVYLVAHAARIQLSTCFCSDWFPLYVSAHYIRPPTWKAAAAVHAAMISVAESIQEESWTLSQNVLHWTAGESFRRPSPCGHSVV